MKANAMKLTRRKFLLGIYSQWVSPLAADVICGYVSVYIWLPLVGGSTGPIAPNSSALYLR